MGGQRKMPVSAHKKTAYGRKISFSHFFLLHILKLFRFHQNFISSMVQRFHGGGARKAIHSARSEYPVGIWKFFGLLTQIIHNKIIYIVKSQISAHSNINTFKYKLWLKFCQSCNDLSLKKRGRVMLWVWRFLNIIMFFIILVNCSHNLKNISVVLFLF